MSESDLVKRARELLNGLPDQKLNTGSTGIYTVPDTTVTEFGGVPIHCIPREVFIDDVVEHSKTVALVFGDESVYYATLFAEAPRLVAELLEALEAAEAEKARLRRTLEVLAEHDPPWNDDFLRARAALKGPDNADG